MIAFMPIPDSVTQEDKDRWLVQFNHFFESGEAEKLGVPAFMNDASLVERAWYPGQWLAEGLMKLGYSRPEIDEINFALGRRSAFSKDPWLTAVSMLADAKIAKLTDVAMDLSVTTRITAQDSDGKVVIDTIYVD